ncbi:MAG: MBOAT family O-acyltransferase [Eubacteriales bacterium]
MLFNSIEFLIFFPIVIIGYFLLPQKFRKYFLLAASCYFYMSFIPKYILILLVTTVVDFTGAVAIDYFNNKGKKKAAIASFVTAVLINVGMLVFFKYLGMLEDTINFFGKKLDMRTVVFPEVVLPIGISFHTFQSMGYLIDVYTGKEKVCKNFIDFALFLMFFPQLVAGPIERYGNLMGQLKAEHHLTYDNISAGGRMMLWGMFKKVVVADNLAMFADAVFDNVGNYSGWGLVVGILCFTIQIYCDFSGYSDIAIGAARVMDIRLMKNFDTPYFSASTPEFWRRWHISLSTWFKDYIYIPLGGNRVSTPRWCFNQLVTFAVSGIWHGASFTFVIWGLLNGIYIVVSRFVKPIKDKFYEITRIGKLPHLRRFIGIAITFVMIALTWVFFRANTFSDVFYVFTHLFTSTTMDFSHITLFRHCVAVIAVAVLLAVDLMTQSEKLKEWYVSAKMSSQVVRLLSYAFILFLIVVLGAYDNKSFIYFQF